MPGKPPSQGPRPFSSWGATGRRRLRTTWFGFIVSEMEQKRLVVHYATHGGWQPHQTSWEHRWVRSSNRHMIWDYPGGWDGGYHPRNRGNPTDE